MYEDDDPVKVYLNQMGKVPPLTREQESECVRHIRSRDEQADDAMRDLVEPVLPSVVAIAQKHPSDQLHILEMIQIGNQALMTAARAFADSDSEDFSAFAALYIESAIEHAVTTPNC